MVLIVLLDNFTEPVTPIPRVLGHVSGRDIRPRGPVPFIVMAVGMAMIPFATNYVGLLAATCVNM